MNGERFKCGCIVGSKDGTMAFQPCSETCDVYAFIVEEMRKQGKSMGVIDLRGQGHRPEALCPFCGKANDGFTSEDHRKRPEPGNASICAYCTEVGIFTEVGIRRPLPAEQEDIRNDAHIQALRKSIRSVPIWGDGN